jgi:hypothetical protein
MELNISQKYASVNLVQQQFSYDLVSHKPKMVSLCKPNLHTFANYPGAHQIL